MADENEMEARKAAAAAEKAKREYNISMDSNQPVTPKVRSTSTPLIKKAAGGSIRGGGCETRGKTKGRMV